MLLVLTNGTYDIDAETASRLRCALENDERTLEIRLDLFSEGSYSETTLAVRHVVAIMDYHRPEAALRAVASGKIRSLS